MTAAKTTTPKTLLYRFSMSLQDNCSNTDNSAVIQTTKTRGTHHTQTNLANFAKELENTRATLHSNGLSVPTPSEPSTIRTFLMTAARMSHTREWYAKYDHKRKT